MPKAIHALRSYPLALLLALLLFACSFLIATSSLGVIRGGGDDEGSGFGGTGKSGSFGDSGFGGTGGPSPFFGDAGDQSIDETTDDAMPQWPAPWLPREAETALIPEEMQPLIELQRNPPVDPLRQQQQFPLPSSRNGLNIFDPHSQDLAPHTRRMLELAESQESTIESPALEIRLIVPEMPSAVEFIPTPFALESLALSEQLREPENLEQVNSDGSGVQVADETTVDNSDNSDVTSQSVQVETAQDATDTSGDTRAAPERIQRPELPPFQRIRPAVDRASIAPPRPQPMRI